MSNDPTVVPQPPVLGYAGYNTVPFESSGGRATVAKIMLIATTALQFLLSALSITFLLGGGIEIDENQDLPGWLMATAIALFLILLLYVVVFIVTIIFFCRWMHLAHRNAFALGIKQPRFSSGWAIGSWFVPFVNLVRPYHAMQDIYDGSAAHQSPARSLIGWWWACWLIGNILSNISTRLEAPETVKISAGLDCVSMILSIAAAALLIKIINIIVERQSATVTGTTAPA